MTTLVRPTLRDVPPEWTAQLRTISPKADGHSYLELVWEEGYPWEPVERFVIYQMHPAAGVPAAILDQLERDTPPQGYYDETLGEFVGEEGCLITRRAHRMYQATKHWGRPFWVIQGTTGGHKRWFSPVEQQMLKTLGLPHEPPAPGDLPYADFDSRVLEQLARHDFLRDEQGRLQRMRTLGQATVHARQREDESRFRGELVKWLRTQIADIAPDIQSALNASTGRRGHQSDLTADADEAEQNFITTGRTDGLAIGRG